MRFDGVLIAWNHDAGYGSIRPASGGDEVFVALAAFPTDGEGPRLDEALSFEVVTGRDGRKQAVHLQRLQSGKRDSALREARGVGYARVRRAQRRRRLSLVAGVLVAGLLIAGVVRLWPHSPSADPRAALQAPR